MKYLQVDVRVDAFVFERDGLNLSWLVDRQENPPGQRYRRGTTLSAGRQIDRRLIENNAEFNHGAIPIIQLNLLNWTPTPQVDIYYDPTIAILVKGNRAKQV